MKETPFLKAGDEIVAQFKSIPFLSSFGVEHLKQIIELSRIRIYQDGETIIQEGESDRWIYMIISGEVSVSKKGGHVTNISGGGSLFGELAALGKKSRSASVTASSPTTCLAIASTILDGSDDADKAVFYAIIFRLLAETMGTRLRAADEEVSKLKYEIDLLKANLIPRNVK